MARLPGIVKQFAQPLQSAKEQANSGRPRAANLLRHFGHREPLQIVQLDNPPLVVRQLGHGMGKT